MDPFGASSFWHKVQTVLAFMVCPPVGLQLASKCSLFKRELLT
jgi:hypothetical protein